MKTILVTALACAACYSQPVIIVVYEDVNAARPLSSLPAHGCVKSVSFGTRLTVEFGDEISPDLSCGDGGSATMRR